MFNARDYRVEPGNLNNAQNFNRRMNTSHDLPDQYRSHFNSTGPAKHLVPIPLGMNSQQELRATDPKVSNF